MTTERQEQAAWTRRELQKHMRAAGWKRIGIGWYEHQETGRTYDFETMDHTGRADWHKWAEKREPPPV